MDTKAITKLKTKQRLLRDEWQAIKVLADTFENQKRLRSLEKRGRRIKIMIEVFEKNTQSNLI